MNDDGNFGIQVLVEAIKKIGNFDIENIDHPTIKETVTNFNNEDAFICNYKSHWLSIRKLHGVWYNLNSANKDPGPQ
jgi:ataxin-3